MPDDPVGPTPLSTQPGEPLPAVEPMPVEPAPRSRAAGTIVLVAVVVAILLCCVCSVGSIFLARYAFDNASEVVDASAISVRWAGDGEFAVIQARDEAGVPIVVVWERETGETRTLEEFFVVAAEPYGARAWLVPAGDPATYPMVRGYERGDTPPGELYVLELAEDELSPVSAAGAEWEPWPGTAGRTAVAEVDPARGAFPSVVWFANPGSAGEDVIADLPRGFGTFEPAGWSASGEHFALVEQWAIEAPATFDVDADAVGEDPLIEGLGRVIIIEAATGDVAAAEEIGLAFGPGTAAAVWHPIEDVLLVAAIDDDADDEDGWLGTTRLRAMVPYGPSVDAAGLLGFEVPPAWDSQLVSLAGAGRDGVVIIADDDIWTLGAEGLVRSGTLTPSYTTASHPTGGILTVFDEWSDQGDAILAVVSVSDHLGGGQRAIWEGPERVLRLGTWRE